MRHLTILTGLTIVAMTALICVGADSSPELPRFDPEQEQEDVKVTLLQVSRVTSFSRQYVNEQSDADVRAIPGLEVLYVVKRTGEAPLGRLTVGATTCFVAGERVRPDPSVVAGGASWTLPATEGAGGVVMAMPEIRSPERARIRREYLRGVRPEADLVDLHIHVGFDELRMFVFENVPLQ